MMVGWSRRILSSMSSISSVLFDPKNLDIAFDVPGEAGRRSPEAGAA
jgi:hypothetical protein